MTKKCFFAVFAIVFTVFFVLSACSKQETELHIEGQAWDGYRDMEGQEFIFRNAIMPANPRDYTEEEAEEAKKNAATTEISLEEEKMLEAVDLVEQKLNCKIIRKSLSTSSASEFAASFAAGQSPTDFMYGEIVFAQDLYLAGYVVPIDEIEAIDKTNYEKWGNADRQMATTYKGVLYGFPTIGSDYYPYAHRYYGILLMNNDAYNSFNLDSTPQEMLENGEWTFSGFQELLPKVYTNDSTDKIWAFVHGDLPVLAVYANGGDLVVKNNRGDYVFGYSQPNALRALEWAKSIYSMTDIATTPTDDAGMDQFYEDRIVFMTTNGYRVFSDFTYNCDNFSWLPFPYGPDAEYGTTHTAYKTYRDSITFLLRNEDPQRVQDAGYVFNELFEPTPYFGKEKYNQYLFRNYFNDGDEASFKVYLDEAANMRYNYSLEITDELYTEVFGKISGAMSGSSSVANVIASVADAVNAQLDKTMNDVK